MKIKFIAFIFFILCLFSSCYRKDSRLLGSYAFSGKDKSGNDCYSEITFNGNIFTEYWKFIINGNVSENNFEYKFRISKKRKEGGTFIAIPSFMSFENNLNFLSNGKIYGYAFNGNELLFHDAGKIAGGKVKKVITEDSIIAVYIRDDVQHIHNWGEWQISKQPTLTEDGSETRICKKDKSHTETRQIASISSFFGTWIHEKGQITLIIDENTLNLIYLLIFITIQEQWKYSTGH